MIDLNGAINLTQVGNSYYLDDNAAAVPLSLRFGGTVFVAGQFGTWAPIGAEKTAGGYEVAWKDMSGHYTAWNTDNNGNHVSNIGNMGWVSGTSTAMEWLGTALIRISMATDIWLVTTAIETQGATDLTQGADHYLLSDSFGSGPSLKFGGTDFATGYFDTWAPIGAEKTAGGYEVAWKDTSGHYTAWNTDNNGNHISNIGNMGWVSGTSTAMESLETSLNQDLNGDGHIGLVTTVIETQGATDLTQVADYYLLSDSLGSGPSLKFGGTDFATG